MVNFILQEHCNVYFGFKPLCSLFGLVFIWFRILTLWNWELSISRLSMHCFHFPRPIWYLTLLSLPCWFQIHTRIAFQALVLPFPQEEPIPPGRRDKLGWPSPETVLLSWSALPSSLDSLALFLLRLSAVVDIWPFAFWHCLFLWILLQSPYLVLPFSSHKISLISFEDSCPLCIWLCEQASGFHPKPPSPPFKLKSLPVIEHQQSPVSISRKDFHVKPQIPAIHTWHEVSWSISFTPN